MDFRNYISSLSLSELREHVNILNSVIVQKQTGPVSSPCSELHQSSLNSGETDIDDFVSYQDKFLDDIDSDLLLRECLTMGFNKKTPSNSVQNRFVSPFNEPYCWNSSNGPVVNQPLELSKYPNIKATMDKVNSAFGCDLNCLLVSFYKSGAVGARLHCDDEEELDHNQPIVVVSLGAVRTVQFVGNNQESFRSNALTISPSSGSAYVMRAGCQQRFRHRVRVLKKIKGYRVSLSFRAFVPSSTRQCDNQAGNVSSLSSFATPGSKIDITPSLPASQDPPSSPSPLVIKPIHELLSTENFPSHKPPSHPQLHDVNSTPHIKKLGLRPSKTGEDDITSPVVCGYSPFPSQNTSSKTTANPSNSNEKICVIFGTSITEGVNEKMMSQGKRTVVNCSSSGANIDDIRQLASDFHHDNIQSIHKVDKLIVSVGTNDVKWYNSFSRNLRRDFKHKLVKLVLELKQLYPHAQINFHTVLPIRIVYKYTASSIHQFNNLLLEVCTEYHCFFFDCFSRFLDRQGIFYNRELYRDNWHLNNSGLKVLCRALKYLIYSNLFNPLPRACFYPRSYPI